jgi:hypothetical protein
MISAQQKLWSSLICAPLAAGLRGADLSAYQPQLFRHPFSHDRSLLSPQFHCCWNGVEGGRRVIEDWLIVLLTGFDLVASEKITFEESSSDGRVWLRGTGAIVLRHERSFASWAPSADPSCFEMAYSLAVGGDLQPANEATWQLDRADFFTSIPLDKLLAAQGCPEQTAAVLRSPQALAMLVALRRVRVKPGAITANALLSVSREQPTWCRALGIN